jgi:hypothetical protein
MYLIKVLSSSGTAYNKVARIEEGCVREIDREAIALYTLVYYSS